MGGDCATYLEGHALSVYTRLKPNMNVMESEHAHKQHEKPSEEDDLLLKQDFSAWPSDDFHSATLAEAEALWPSGKREDGSVYVLMKHNVKGIAEGRLMLGKGRMQIRHLKGEVSKPFCSFSPLLARTCFCNMYPIS